MTAGGQMTFASDARSARRKDVPGMAAAVAIMLAAAVAAFVVWSRYAVLDEVTRGTGSVVPAQQVQVVQSLEGGIVSEILVREGERVEKDQVLLRLDETSSGARLGELAGQRYARLARIVRLKAEAEGRREPDFSADLRRMAPELTAAETDVFTSRREALSRQRAVLTPQLEQRREELVELDARQRKFTDSLVLLERELELTRKLSAQGAVPELELIRLERETVEARGELDEIGARRERVKAGVREYENRLASMEADYRAQARIELAREIGEIKVIGESIAGAADRVKRTAIRAPVRGIVNRIAVTTIGGVVAPGAPVLDIVPLDDRLVIEAQIQPKDVAFIQPGQEASIKLSAYDYTVYGSLPGRVTQVGATTVADPQSGQPFYRVVVETEMAALRHDGKDLDIIPGMVATVDIKTGRKSVFDYLVKPMNRVRHEAMRER